MYSWLIFQILDAKKMFKWFLYYMSIVHIKWDVSFVGITFKTSWREASWTDRKYTIKVIVRNNKNNVWISFGISLLYPWWIFFLNSGSFNSCLIVTLYQSMVESVGEGKKRCHFLFVPTEEHTRAQIKRWTKILGNGPSVKGANVSLIMCWGLSQKHNGWQRLFFDNGWWLY